MAHNQGDDYLQFEQLLAACDSEVSASEADGRLLGLAALLGADAAGVWLDQLGVSAEAADVMQHVAQLVSIAERRLGILDRGAALPDLCVPDDNDDLRDRVESIGLWAGGFVSGVGEGAALRGTPARERLEREPLEELLKDLTEISRVEIAEDELDGETNAAETAYNEVLEFLRVAAQLFYEEMLPVRDIEQPSTSLVH